MAADRSGTIFFSRGFFPVPGLILTGIYLLVSLIIIDDFGITWDEPRHFAASDRYLEVLEEKGLGAVFTPEDFTNSLQYYGPVFDIWGAVNHRIFSEKLGWLPADNSRHLHLVITSALTVLFTYLLIGSITGGSAGLFSALFLIGLPRFFGHSFNNPKDIPITCIYVLIAYLFWLRFQSGRKIYSLIILLAGGIGFATRIQYVIMPLIIILYIILYYQERIKVNLFRKIFRFWDLICAFILSIPAGLAFWPYFWSDSLVRLKELFDFYYFHRIQYKLSIN